MYGSYLPVIGHKIDLVVRRDHLSDTFRGAGVRNELVFQIEDDDFCDITTIPVGVLYGKVANSSRSGGGRWRKWRRENYEIIAMSMHGHFVAFNTVSTTKY